MNVKRILFLALTATAIVAPFARADSLIVGGFDSARAGSFSLTSDTSLEDEITGQFPDSTFTSTTTLTSSYLDTVNALIIVVATGCCSAITPLSASEQAALLGFVEDGGTALLFTDNSTFAATAPAVNNSFLSPFGLSAEGTLDGPQSSTIVDDTNPVIDGPAGTATGFATDYPGWFSSLGPAQELAELTANGEPDLAVLMPGSLGPGSGAAVFFADGNYIGQPSDDTLILNALALASPSPVATPEPGPAILLLIGVIAFIPRLLRCQRV